MTWLEAGGAKLSETVMVTVYGLFAEAPTLIEPLMTPVVGWIDSPGGRLVAA